MSYVPVGLVNTVFSCCMSSQIDELISFKRFSNVKQADNNCRLLASLHFQHAVSEAEWLRQFHLRNMKRNVHDLEVIGLNSIWAELGVRSTSKP